MERWISKIALVTGASAGIGTAIVKKLVENGMKVVGCARNLNEISSKINENGKGEMFPCQCDLSKEDEIIKMFQFIKEKFGTIHVCVNNAALSRHASVLYGKTEDWRDMINVNVLGVCIVTREAVSLMRSSGVDDGHVITMNSLSGHRVIGTNTVYCATKFAIKASTEALRCELREEKSNIRSTAISPGIVKTEFEYRKNYNDSDRVKDLYPGIHALQPSDIADAIQYVLSLPPHMEINDVLLRPTQQNF